MPIFARGDVKAKLLILFFLRGVSFDATDDHAYRCLFELGLLDYFTFRNSIYELEQEGFIAEVPRAFGQTCKLTRDGTSALDMFEESLPLSERKAILAYIEEHTDEMLGQTLLTSSTEPADKGGYIVTFTASEGNRIVLEIKMQLAAEETAMLMRKNWAKQSGFIYDTVYERLTKE
ncbi:MAG: DUF4364 family protein [Clostridia bacterium]|nr:DUF4364 family protein [Clostridia bacterium]